MAVEKQGQDECEEEEDGIHDAQGPGGLQHGTILVDVQRPLRSARTSIITKRAEIDIDGVCLEAGTVCISNPTKVVDCGDEGADEAKIDESHKKGGTPGRPEADEGRQGPCAG